MGFSITEKLNKDSIEVFVYHPETYEYVDRLYLTKEEYENIKDKEPATVKQPLSIPYDSYRKVFNNVFNKEKDNWELLEDYRNFFYNNKFIRVERNYSGYLTEDTFRGYYLPLEGDTNDSPRRFNSTFGPLPKGAVVGNLPTLETMIDKLKEKNEIKYISMVASLLEDDQLKKDCEYNEYIDNVIMGKVHKNLNMYGNTEHYTVCEDNKSGNKIRIQKAINEIKLNILTRAKLGDESALEVVDNFYDRNDNDIYKVLTKIDKLTMCYEYYKCWLKIKKENNSNYKEVYQEYINIESPDYEKIKIELGI